MTGAAASNASCRKGGMRDLSSTRCTPGTCRRTSIESASTTYYLSPNLAPPEYWTRAWTTLPSPAVLYGGARSSSGALVSNAGLEGAASREAGPRDRAEDCISLAAVQAIATLTLTVDFVGLGLVRPE